MGEVTHAAAPSILLLHGQPGAAADWQGVIDRLPADAGAIAIDRPGWDGVSPARDLAGNAAAALAALDDRRVARAVVVGHSLGAAIAAWLAAEHPERVAALVLAAPAANQAALYPIDRWLAAPLVGELVGTVTLGALGAGLAVPLVRRLIAAGTGLQDAYLSAAGALMLRPGAWRSYAREQRALVGDLPQLERRLAAIRVPTTILAGADDHVVPLRAARRLADQIAGARLLVSEHAGHLLPQADPGLVADAVLAALAAARCNRLPGGGV